MLASESALGVVDALYGFLDRSPTAIVLLDGHRRIVYANDQATALESRGDGIVLSTGTLALARPPDHARLQELIAQALGGGTTTGTAMRVSRLSGRRPYGVFVAPVFRQQGPAPFRPAVCVVITDPDSHVLTADRLNGLFSLTEAEGRLAALLAGGDDLRTAARRLGITYGTARARLAEIFQKTETRRQGELIRLLLTTHP